MDELLFYAKIVLLLVLIYDVVILFRKPEEGSKVVVLNFWKELERKGINGVLIPCTMIFIISLDYAQGLNLTLSFVLFILSMIYIAYPRPFALGKNGILMDGKTIIKDRLLKAKPIKVVKYLLNGILADGENLPDCNVTDAILEELRN